MSCSVVIPINIAGDPLSIAMLLEGVRQLGLGLQELGQIIDQKGHACAVDHVITTKAGEHIGIVKQKDGSVGLVVADPNKQSIKESVDQIKQAYSRLKVIDQVKRQGYQNVKEEKLPDGSVRLVVQKWHK